MCNSSFVDFIFDMNKSAKQPKLALRPKTLSPKVEEYALSSNSQYCELRIRGDELIDYVRRTGRGHLLAWENRFLQMKT